MWTPFDSGQTNLSGKRNASATSSRSGNREEECLGVESLPLRYVIHTVHGTFAKNASWAKPASYLSHGISESLGGQVKIEPFDWSAKNTVAARWEAALGLRTRIAKSRTDFPHAHQVIIAHSHGGNVALWALNDQTLASEILGLITLSTPFLTAQCRPEKNLIDVPTGLMGGFFLTCAVLFFSVYGGHGWNWWPWALAGGTIMLAVMAAGRWGIHRMREHSQSICEQMPRTALTSKQLSILRVPGDEAIAAITGVRLAGTLADLLWNVLSTPTFELLETVIEHVDYLGIRSLMARFDHAQAEVSSRLMNLDLLLDPNPDSHLPTDEVLTKARLKSSTILRSSLQREREEEFQWRSTLWELIATSLGPLLVYLVQQGSPVERMVSLVCGLIWAAPAAFCFLFVILRVPFAILTSITLVLCGWTLPLAGPYLQLMADCCPPGSWNVTQLRAETIQRGLFHSAAYEHYDAPKYVAEWIQKRASEFATIS